MAIVENLYTGNGSTTLYSFTFPYLDESHVKVTLNGTPTTAYVFASATSLQFTSAPGAGVAIRIYRETDDTDLEATFFPGSSIRASDLNNDFDQLLYLGQESSSIAGAATTTANTALTNSNTAISTANSAVSTANGAVSTANAAVVTANTASSNASAAVSTANTASSNASAAVSTANAASSAAASAVSTANSAVSTANSATSTANSALSAANSAVSTANTASSNASAAVSTANTASSNASAAVSTANSATSTANSALSTANTALSNSSTAISTANSAAAAVASAVIYQPVVDLAALALLTPADGDFFELQDSTGAESDPDITGVPVGLVGAAGLTFRLRYDDPPGEYVFLGYFANDSETRYLKLQGGTVTGNLEIGTTGSLTFEGSTADAFETTLAVVDPTADRTITIPNVTGTVVTTGDTGTVTSTMIADGTIVDGDVNASAAIAGTKISPDFGSQALTTTGLISANGKVSFPLGTAALPSLYPGTDTNTGIYSPGADQVAISTNGTGRLFVDASGNVSLNTGTTGNTLTFPNNGSIGFAGSIAQFTTNSAFSSGADRYLLSGNEAARYYQQSGVHIWQTASAGTAGNAVSFLEAMRLDSSGRLGLGTSSPDTLLHISSATGSASPTPTEFRIATTSNASDWSTTDPWGRISFYSGDTSGGARVHASINTIANAAVGGTSSLTFNTADVASAAVERLRITNTGLVGIGTTSPSALLTVSSGEARLDLNATNASGRLWNLYSGGGGNVGAGAFAITEGGATQRFLIIGGGSGEGMRLDASNRLLVGTSSSTLQGSGAAATQQIATFGTTGTLAATNYGSGSAPYGAHIWLGASRGSTAGSATAVESGDRLGEIRFFGGDGTDLDSQAAWISCYVDGTPGANDMPGRLVFSTTADGASSPTERLRISSDGSMSAVIPGGSTLYPAFTCRAWVNFDGTGTPAIRASGNVSSITDNGTGNYTVNFTTALADADYAMVASGSDGGSGPTTYVQEGTRLTTSCPVLCLQRDGNVRDDADFQCAFFR